MTNLGLKGAEVFVRCLENEEVKHVFAVPGEENLEMLEALRRSSIQLVVTRHEQAAGFMAATYGRLTGKPGVCMSTLGPGATNLVTAAAYASLGEMPMLMITGQKGILGSRQARFQLIDTVAMMRPLTKSAKQIVAADRIPTLVRDAFRVAQSERPGPVHLELPEDIAAQITSSVVPVTVGTSFPPTASIESIDRACRAIAASERPLLVIGGGANRPGLASRLSAAVRQLRIPFLNTQMGKGAINGNSDLYMGTAALSQKDYVHLAIECADLVITVGHDTVEKSPFIMLPSGPRVVHVDSHPADIDQIYFPEIEVIGDIGKSMTQLADALEGKVSPISDELSAIRQLVLAQTGECSDDGRYPMVPQRIVSDVRAVLPEEGILCLDNGMYKIWFARNYRTHISNTILLDNALATMGAGLPSAIMAAMLYPSRRVMAVCGDGGFMMSSQEIETAMRLRLNLVVLILEDGQYGMIRWKQELDGFEDFGLTFGNPDFVKYAEAFGAKGSCICAPDDLRQNLEQAFREGGVHVIVVPIDYSENRRVLGATVRRGEVYHPSATSHGSL